MRISYWSSDVCSSDLARPRSDETMTEPTRLICARSTRYGCWNSEFACAMWPITCFIARAYGREAFIRSCALRILEAETISSARVTLRVFCTLLLLVLRSEEHTSELQSLMRISYAVFCLKKKKTHATTCQEQQH